MEVRRGVYKILQQIMRYTLSSSPISRMDGQPAMGAKLFIQLMAVSTDVAQDIGSYDDLDKLYFIDNYKGWAVGGYYDIQTGFYNRVIYNTIDAGNTWNLQYGMSYETGLRSIYFTDSNTGYAAGVSGAFMNILNEEYLDRSTKYLIFI